MTVRIITAPEQPTTKTQPVLFLAGPIQGAPNWQAEAIDHITTAAGLHRASLDIANPRRPIASMGEFTREMYVEQVRWEHHYLRIAGYRGVTLFWLAKEAQHVEGRSYGQTTRFELGEAVTLHRLAGQLVVVGIEDGFTGASYVRLTLAEKAPNIPIVKALDAACAEAVAIGMRHWGQRRLW